MNTEDITIQTLKKYNLKANKRFGQNFLIDDNILQGIVEAADVTSEDIVVEIGPGLGNLTEYLLKKAKKVVAFEIDENMIEVLQDRFKSNKLEIIFNDILKVNIDNYIYSIIANMDSFKGKVKVVANLPYYITTPIIFDLFENTTMVSDITIMIQKEVAERIVAMPGCKEYGVLSVMCRYYSDAELKIQVPPSSFIPQPNVSSAVITLTKSSKYKLENNEVFVKLVKLAFSQRRKKMVNSLANTKFLGLSKDHIVSICREAGIKDGARAEEIGLEKYLHLAEMFIKENKENK
ncbi:MAG: 16S rRNA (adenine(1518)-N(6)/adenine(1519)-N(6))-dimethyltransferase RsmA [Clostridia bacterium]